MYEIIDGKATAQSVREGIKNRADSFFEKHGQYPSLTVILVGNDPASAIYVRNKQRACEKSDIKAETLLFDEKISTEFLLGEIDRLNKDKNVNGILVQLPLPKQIDTNLVLNAIAPEKDVDGFHPYNAGLLFKSESPLEPCTPKGCVELLKRYKVPLDGAEVVIIGRSNLVGRPLARMLERENCTVTLCHTHTKDVSNHTKRADIVVCAVGKPNVLTADMVKDGAVIIDVGINRREDGTICGDVDFESVSSRASKITPVPGGVGPMTIAMLLENTCIAAEAQNA